MYIAESETSPPAPYVSIRLTGIDESAQVHTSPYAGLCHTGCVRRCVGA